MTSPRLIVFVAFLFLAACGEEVALDAFPAPTWAKVAPEQIAEAKKHGVPVAFENELGMRFVLIPAGTFRMGSPVGEAGRDEDEILHEVTIPKPFYMQVHELTVAEYARKEGGVAPPAVGDSRKPATDVSWDDAWAFAAWLGEQNGARTYILPSEAQWEYACRAGTTTAYSTGPDIDTDQALWRVESRGAPDRTVAAQVGGRRPNAWGLFDMHGNVWEWCSDYYVRYSAVPVEDPAFRRAVPIRVMRGGSFLSPKSWMRSAHRGMDHQTSHMFDIGFRLVSPVSSRSAGS